MKKSIWVIFILPLVLCYCSPAIHTTTTVQYDRPPETPPPPPEAAAPVGYEMFYNDLSAYGRWIDFPGEGYAWAPDADQDFRPYSTNGHWVYSTYGWTWVSGYPWGWATFHYGRWLFQDGYGWIWFPGHEWAPAWVTWGNSGDYYGWAPLPPHININISMGGNNWTPPQHYWNFVPKQHITQVNVNNYVINKTNNVTVVNNITQNVTIINNNTTIKNNSVTNNNVTNNTTVYNQGPRLNEVENITKNKVNVVTINETSKPGASALANNNLSMYRPQVKQPPANPNAIKPAPPKVEAFKPAAPINPSKAIVTDNLKPQQPTQSSAPDPATIHTIGNNINIKQQQQTQTVAPDPATIHTAGNNNNIKPQQQTVATDTKNVPVAVDKKPIPIVQPSTVNSTPVKTTAPSQPSANTNGQASTIFTKPVQQNAVTKPVTTPPPVVKTTVQPPTTSASPKPAMVKPVQQQTIVVNKPPVKPMPKPADKKIPDSLRKDKRYQQ